MSILFGNGNGTFSVPSGHAELGPGLVALVDLDQDGRSEGLFTSVAPSYELRVLWHLANGGTTTTAIPLSQIPNALVTGDFNKDYAPDVAVGTGSAIQLYTNACPSGRVPNSGQSRPRP